MAVVTAHYGVLLKSLSESRTRSAKSNRLSEGFKGRAFMLEFMLEDGSDRTPRAGATRAHACKFASSINRNGRASSEWRASLLRARGGGSQTSAAGRAG